MNLNDNYTIKLKYYNSKNKLLFLDNKSKYTVPTLSVNENYIYLDYLSTSKILTILEEVFPNFVIAKKCNNCNLINLPNNRNNFLKFGILSSKIYNQEIISDTKVKTSLELSSIFKLIKNNEFIAEIDNHKICFSNNNCFCGGTTFNLGWLNNFTLYEDPMVSDLTDIPSNLRCNSRLIDNNKEETIFLLIELSKKFSKNNYYIIEHPSKIALANNYIQILSEPTLNSDRKIIDYFKIREELTNFYLCLNQAKELGITKKNINNSILSYKGIKYSELESLSISSALYIFSHLKNTNQKLKEVEHKELALGAPVSLIF